ncbi:c-type cytochrome [Tropicimonas aquimaris]|uniref:C-type cytochrome n=1 Tax=Tropicimonas aquimaris TaxID=914152 RepID=A0ABW3INW6_9RHOB
MKRNLLAGAALLAASMAPAAAETPEERGAYLVRGPAGCGNCHSPMGPQGPIAEQELAGRLVEQNDAFTAIAPNITPAGRIAGWSDEDLGRAIREGVRPDGSVIGPPMPFLFYRNLSDSDVAAIVAFLRTVPAVEHDPGTSVYNVPLPPAYGPPVESVPDIPRGVTVEYGEYLAGPVAHCMECHTTFGPAGPMLDTDFGRGGFEFHGPWGVSVAPNITSHEDGLAGYSDEEIATMITKGTRPDGSPMLPPMPFGYLAQMTEEDLQAIILYLRSVPPLPDKS